MRYLKTLYMRKLSGAGSGTSDIQDMLKIFTANVCAAYRMEILTIAIHAVNQLSGEVMARSDDYF